MKISAAQYSMMYGPTVGDKVRLADTNLIIEVEKDYTTYGEESKFGGGKTLRDGMGPVSYTHLGVQTYNIQDAEWSDWRAGCQCPCFVDGFRVGNILGVECLCSVEERHQQGVEDVAWLLFFQAQRHHEDLFCKFCHSFVGFRRSAGVSHDFRSVVSPNLVGKVECLSLIHI